MLKSYLNQTAPNYSEYISKMTPDLNKPLLTAFKNTAITQSTGEKTGNSAICYLGSPKVSPKDKLSYIDEVATKGGILQIAPHLVRFFESFNLKDLSENDKVQFNKIKQNENGKKQILGFTHEPIPGLIKPQVDVLNLALKFEWVDKAKYNEILSNIALKPLYSQGEFSTGLKDQICSVNIKVASLDYQKIKPEHWSNPNFIQALECLAISMDEVVNMVKETMYKKANDSSYRQSAMSYFKSTTLSKSTVNEIVEFQIKNIGIDSTRAREVLDILIKSKHSDMGLAKKIHDLMTSVSDPESSINLFSIYFQLVSGHEETLIKTLDYLFSTSAPIWQISEMVSSPVKEVINSNQNIKNKISSYFADKTNQKRIEKLVWLIKTSDVKIPNMQNIFMDLLRDNSTKITTKLLILSYIKEQGFYNETMLKPLIEIYKTSNSFQITQSLLDILLVRLNDQELHQSLFVSEDRILLKARMSQYNVISENKGIWTFDESAYKKEIKNQIAKISLGELNQQIKVLNDGDNSTYALDLYGIMFDLQMNDLVDYRSPDGKVDILTELSASSVTVLMDTKTKAVIRAESETICNFRAKNRDYEDDCLELSSPGKDVIEIRSLMYRSSHTVDLFTYDQKQQVITFRITDFPGLMRKAAEKIEAGHPKYAAFFEDHGIDFMNMTKLSPTQYKFEFNYESRHRHGDAAMLDAEAIINVKTSSTGQQTYEIIKTATGKYDNGEGG